MKQGIHWATTSFGSVAHIPPELATELAPLITAQDIAGLETFMQRVFGLIPNWRDFSLLNEQTGATAYRNPAGVWSFSDRNEDWI